MKLLRSWWKQESMALKPRQRQRLLQMSAVLLLGLTGLNLQRHHQRKLDQRDTELQQASELASAQWETIRATAYDWAHWDETHAYARGMAPGYPARNLQVATGLTSVAPVVLILNRKGNLLTLEGRKGPSSWASDPLVRCSRNLARPVFSQPQTRGISCRDQSGRRLWIGVIEPITDTNEQDELSGLMVLLAPLRHPNHGGELQALMATLERQLQLAPPGPSALLLQGRTIWGDDQRVLRLSPEPVMVPSVQALGRDVAIATPFLLLFLTLRAALLLQRRHQDLNQRHSEQRSRRRLRRARRQLDVLFDQLPLQERERALSRLAPTSGDPIDDLARRLEAYSASLQQHHGLPLAPLPLLFAPMHDRQGQLRRLQVQGNPLDAVSGWASLPAAWRRNLGLQFEPSPAQWGDQEFSAALQANLRQHGCPVELCTLAVRAEPIARTGSPIQESCTRLHSAGFRLALIHTNGVPSDPALLLQCLPFAELQLSVPSPTDPHLEVSEQALFTALMHLGEARGLQISVINLQARQQRDALDGMAVDLLAGPLIGAPVQDPSALLMNTARHGSRTKT